MVGLAAVLATGLDRAAEPTSAAAAPGADGSTAVRVEPARATAVRLDPVRSAAADTARWSARARADTERDVRESRALAAAALAAATGLDPLRIAPDLPPALADLDDAVADLRAVAATLATTSGAATVVLDRDVRTVSGPVGAGSPSADAPLPDVSRVPVVARTVPARLAAAADVRAAATDVFRLSLAVESQAPQTLTDARTPDGAGLIGLERAAARATRAAETLTAGVEALPRSLQATPGVLRADGTVDPSVLCPVPFAPGARLRCDAVADLVRLNEVFRAEHDADLPVGDTYRTYEQQVVLKAAKGFLAATPGESRHGWGVAVDFRGFGGVGDFDEPLYRWMVAHAPAFGWVHPEGMGPDGPGPHEPWHWEYAGAA